MAPTRTCVGCRSARPVGSLVRVVRRPDGSLAVDRRGPGRGAWLCEGSLACATEAVRRNTFGRALRAAVGAEQAQRLLDELAVMWGRPRDDVRG